MKESIGLIEILSVLLTTDAICASDKPDTWYPRTEEVGRKLEFPIRPHRVIRLGLQTRTRGITLRDVSYNR